MQAIRTTAAPLGAEIRGVDLAAGADEATMASIRDALHEHKVIVLRRQTLSPEQHIAFSAYFGQLEPHILPQYLVPGYQALVRLSNIVDGVGRPIGMVDAGRIWHTDGHFLERPNMYSILFAIEVPHADSGEPLGATRFANTASAYSQLPDATKRRLEGLQGVNSLAAVYETMRRSNVGKERAPLTEEQRREFVHPVVRTHPETGEKCIYVSKAATSRILGLSQDESDALIDELSAWCVRDDQVYNHRWQIGDLLMWDNCATQHVAVGDYGPHQRRLMHRTTLGGSIPF